LATDDDAAFIFISDIGQVSQAECADNIQVDPQIISDSFEIEVADIEYWAEIFDVIDLKSICRAGYVIDIVGWRLTAIVADPIDFVGIIVGTAD